VGSKKDEKSILKLYKNGVNNEILNLSLVDKDEIKQLEPNISETESILEFYLNLRA
jgi:L-2-hydroxyglutarate oxidase LhgO